MVCSSKMHQLSVRPTIRAPSPASSAPRRLHHYYLCRRPATTSELSDNTTQLWSVQRMQIADLLIPPENCDRLLFPHWWQDCKPLRSPYPENLVGRHLQLEIQSSPGPLGRSIPLEQAAAIVDSSCLIRRFSACSSTCHREAATPAATTASRSPTAF